MAHYMEAGRDVSLVFDLVWTAVSDASASSIREAAGDASLAVAVKNAENEYTVGCLTLPEGEKAKRNPISFAALIAHQFKTERALLLFIELENEQAMMAAVRNGQPVPDCDRYGNYSELREAAREFLDETPGARIIGTTNAFEGVEPFDINAFLADKATRKLFKSATLRKIDGNRRPMLLLAVAVAVGAFIAYDLHQEKVKKEEMARAAANQKSPEQLYREALPEAFAQAALSHDSTERLLKTALALPVDGGGWRVNTIKCEADGCTSTWVRTLSVATFEDLLGAIGKDNLALITGDTAIKRVPLGAAKPLSVNEEKLPSQMDAWLRMLPPLQRTGNLVSFGVSQSVPFVAGGATPEGPYRVSKGEITVKGPLWALDYMKSLPPWAALRTITFTIKEGGHSSQLDATLVFFSK